MTDNTELKRLAEAAPEGPCTYWGESANEIFQASGHRVLIIAHDQSVPACKFIAAANPAVVLALIAENERLAEDEQEAADLCDRLSDLLRNTAIEVRGPEEPLKRHGFHDLPSRVKTVVAERDRLRAEVAGLRTGYEAYERVNAELKAEVEALRRVTGNRYAPPRAPLTGPSK